MAATDYQSGHWTFQPQGNGRALRFMCFFMASCLWLLMICSCGTASAAVLPEDRADFMYHYYDGGGTKADGAAVLVREGVGDRTSLQASYYADSITGASVDVVTTASPYKDKRDEYGLSGDYIYRENLMTLSVLTSRESDYLADTYSFDIARDYMGGLTTLSMGYSTGHDLVLRNTDSSFARTVDRYQYRLGLSQVLVRNLVMSVNYEAIADDGYLSNPYRSALLQGGTAVPERYPSARTSHAVAVQLWHGLNLFDKYALRSSVKFDYRAFWDTWDINAHTVEVGYQQYLGRRLLADWRGRYYSQSKALFYSDSFPVPLLYMARDKELSSFTDYTLGFKLSYRWVDRGTFKVTQSLAYDYLKFYYDDFTDLRTGQAYSFQANSAQMFVSFWY